MSIAIGTLVNGYTVASMTTQYRAGRPDGVVILGFDDTRNTVRNHAYVVATIPQDVVDGTDPKIWWISGDYATDVAAATRTYLHKSGLADLAGIDARVTWNYGERSWSTEAEVTGNGPVPVQVA